MAKQTILAVVNIVNKFLKTWSGWMYQAVVDRKLGDQWLTLMQLDEQYWKSLEVYLWLSAKHKEKRSTVHSVLQKD